VRLRSIIMIAMAKHDCKRPFVTAISSIRPDKPVLTLDLLSKLHLQETIARFTTRRPGHQSIKAVIFEHSPFLPSRINLSRLPSFIPSFQSSNTVDTFRRQEFIVFEAY
jgi:hypothetical protein